MSYYIKPKTQMIQYSRDKNIIKKFFSSKVFLFVAIFVLIFFIISVGRENYHKYQLTKEINNLKLEIERLDGNNQQLANLMDYFKEESFLEKEARLKLNLKKPGENVVIISDYFDSVNLDNAHDANIKDTLSQNITSEKSANYWKWWEYFFQ